MGKKFLIYSIFIFFLALAPVVEIAYSTETCDQYGIVDVNGGEYKVQNNVWGSSAGQCVDGFSTGFTVTKADHNQNDVAAYPSIFKGCHWDNCTNNSGMPIQVSSISSATISWSVSLISSGKWNVTSEAWIKKNSNPGQPDGTELMIWINAHGDPYPGGSKVGTVNIEGATWDVYYTNIGWNFVTYKRQGYTTSVNIDYRPFIDDCISRGYTQNSWYLMDIEAGFELFQGGAGLKTSSFSCSVNGGGSTDNEPPVITINGDNPMTIYVGDNFSDPGATATDNKDGNLTNNIQSSGYVDNWNEGTYTITYTVSDAAGDQATATRTVYVEPAPDTDPPVITLNGDNPMTINVGDNFNDPGATASDAVDGNLTGSIQTSGTVQTWNEGTYTITYTVLDAAGNQSTATRTVNVEPVSAITIYINELVEQQHISASIKSGSYESVRFSLSSPQNVSLNIMNTRGIKVAAIYNGFLKEGVTKIIFPTHTLSRGIYIAILKGKDIKKSWKFFRVED